MYVCVYIYIYVCMYVCRISRLSRGIQFGPTPPRLLNSVEISCSQVCNFLESLRRGGGRFQERRFLEREKHMCLAYGLVSSVGAYNSCLVVWNHGIL